MPGRHGCSIEPQSSAACKTRVKSYHCAGSRVASDPDAFNIWYNIAVVDPLLATPELKRRFLLTVIVYNSLCYPVCAYVWLRLVYALRPAFKRLQNDDGIPEALLHRMRRRVFRLPFWGTLICGAGWLLCIPVFLFALGGVDGDLDSRLFWHLPISFGVSGFISLTHSFFLIELAIQWGLFPVFFRETRADLTPERGFPRSVFGETFWGSPLARCFCLFAAIA